MSVFDMILRGVGAIVLFPSVRVGGQGYLLIRSRDREREREAPSIEWKAPREQNDRVFEEAVFG